MKEYRKIVQSFLPFSGGIIAPVAKHSKLFRLQTFIVSIADKKVAVY